MDVERGTIEPQMPLVRDGRLRRSTNTRAAILASCRALMIAGHWRQHVDMIARDVCSTRSVFHHFTSLDALYREALQSIEVRYAITAAIFGADWVSVEFKREWFDLAVRAAVLGKVEG